MKQAKADTQPADTQTAAEVLDDVVRVLAMQDCRAANALKEFDRLIHDAVCNVARWPTITQKLTLTAAVAYDAKVRLPIITLHLATGRSVRGSSYVLDGQLNLELPTLE